jgi:hypothetical protein
MEHRKKSLLALAHAPMLDTDPDLATNNVSGACFESAQLNEPISYKPADN